MPRKKTLVKIRVQQIQKQGGLQQFLASFAPPETCAEFVGRCVLEARSYKDLGSFSNPFSESLLSPVRPCTDGTQRRNVWPKRLNLFPVTLPVLAKKTKVQRLTINKPSFQVIRHGSRRAIRGAPNVCRSTTMGLPFLSDVGPSKVVGAGSVTGQQLVFCC